jgi:hypothetical protein
MPITLSVLAGRLELRVPGTHEDCVLHDAERFCADALRRFERRRGLFFSRQDRESLMSFLIAEVWTFHQSWEQVSARYDSNFRFVPACSRLVQRRVIDWLRIEHGRPGNARYEAVVLSLDASAGDREPLGHSIADRDGSGFEERAASLMDLVAALSGRG